MISPPPRERQHQLMSPSTPVSLDRHRCGPTAKNTSSACARRRRRHSGQSQRQDDRTSHSASCARSCRHSTVDERVEDAHAELARVLALGGADSSAARTSCRPTICSSAISPAPICAAGQLDLPEDARSFGLKRELVDRLAAQRDLDLLRPVERGCRGCRRRGRTATSFFGFLKASVASFFVHCHSTAASCRRPRPGASRP